MLAESLRGRERLDERTAVNGTVGKFRTGSAWRDAPERYGRWATLHLRFRRWTLDGTFGADARGSTGRTGRGRGHRLARVGRLHRRPRTPSRRQGPKRGLCRPTPGRSRGGLTSKIHLVCDAIVRPHAFTVTGGKRRDIVERVSIA
ncbi:transposase [Streptomyces sp. NBC_00842]|uniref:transposase n=1 Tax=unclassified Streptomyces TaxID=2593676 RepID=UPI003863F38A